MARRTDGLDKRAPLDRGNARRMTDARCAWRKMTLAQRDEFLEEIGAVIEHDDDDGIGHARLTDQEAYDIENPPMRDNPMDWER